LIVIIGQECRRDLIHLKPIRAAVINDPASFGVDGWRQFTNRTGTPMTSFDRREEGFEAKFVHDEESAFRLRTHALRMLGLWAAAKRGETGKAAEDYARLLIDADIGGTQEAAFNKLVLDLSNCGVDAKQIREKRDELFAAAQRAPD
jgi:hypothetical protein